MSMSDSSAPSDLTENMSEGPKRRGRPRLKPSTTEAPPAEEILEVAARMFADVGYEQTSFAAIAETVGVQRASLYHHYANKEALLLEIGLLWLEPLVELLDRFDEEGGPADLRLYRYLRIDLRHIKSAPYDLGRIYHLRDEPWQSEADPASKLVDTIHDAWVRWIAAAVEAGTFRPINPRLLGSLIEAAYLGVLSSDRPDILADVGKTVDSFVDLMVAGLLADPLRLDELRAQALAHDGVDPALADVLA